MSAKHKVSTDALDTLGTTIGPEACRDAIHLAVDPAVAGEVLEPGDHVGRSPDGRWTEQASPKLGIVDPFLKRPVKVGERFFVVVYPRTITSLRHVWSHPDFPEEASAGLTVVQAHSKEWLTRYADEEVACEYDELMAAADRFQSRGEWWSEGDRFESLCSVPDEFWSHWSAATGRIPNRDGGFFSCSC